MDTQNVQGAETSAVVTEQSIMDRIAEAHGHVERPPDSFTVREYCERLKSGGVMVRETHALQVLRGEMEAGRLHGRKMHMDGRQRWVFWE